jgi:16S rRNA (cytidine1402-2'-O)-methyltransferase
MEQTLLSTGQTQLFMETPYRNEKLLEVLLKNLKPQTKLCVAVNISNEKETIITTEVMSWKADTLITHKEPAIFLIGA